MPGRPRDADGHGAAQVLDPGVPARRPAGARLPAGPRDDPRRELRRLQGHRRRLGFLDELCSHRGASLALGRVEDCGIRCLYHGWKYAVDGTIMETPNLAAPTFRERVKHGAYPVREAGGLAWVYLGPPGTEPPFPAFAWSTADPDELLVTEMIMDCNWMQVLEGSIDSSHVGVLHLDTLATMRPARAASARSTSPGNRGTWICRCPAGAGKAARARARRPGGQGSGPVTTTRRASRSRTPRSASTTRRSGT